MGPVADQPPLIVILGQTASGKSALAMQLAQRFNGEIIAADSRTIYKGMDIGTAKPMANDRQLVRHHLVDIITPDQRFTAADFKRLAQAAVVNIATRRKLAFLVGGSGLYVDALIYNFSFRPPAAAEYRMGLEALAVKDLQALLAERGLALPENKNNPRHLIRALEAKGSAAKRSTLRPNTLVIGLRRAQEDLEHAIAQRVEQMFAEGFVAEAQTLAERYGWGAPALQVPGYKAVRMYLAGQISLEQAKQQCIRSHMQYAKRQKTWFKRNPDIHWISNSEEAVELVTTFLNK